MRPLLTPTVDFVFISEGTLTVKALKPLFFLTCGLMPNSQSSLMMSLAAVLLKEFHWLPNCLLQSCSNASSMNMPPQRAPGG